jgi:hypothetical protein
MKKKIILNAKLDNQLHDYYVNIEKYTLQHQLRGSSLLSGYLLFCHSVYSY